MMSLAGVSRAVVPALACPVALLAAFLDSGAPAPGARAAADGAGTADPAADELAELAEHPARIRPPASMTPPIAALRRMSLVRADRRFKLTVFPMPV
jgi:hypothetical protein